jgi:hydroxymethylbilane synthase
VLIRIGSRGSALALWQAEHVRQRLAALGHEATIRVIITTGDRIQDRRLDVVGGKGAFLKEIEEAMLAEEVDLAVHSLKDVPTALPAGLRLCAVLERADPRDALLSRAGLGLKKLPAGARVGTTSLRRRAQVAALRPDLVVQDLRGNVDTRIRKLGEGECDALLLAVAGLERLGRRGEATEVLEPDVFLPAPGQGAIALECRQGDDSVGSATGPLRHAPTERAVAAERALLAGLHGGCNVPLGAYAREEREDGDVRLTAFVARPDGSGLLRGQARDADPLRAGAALAEQLLARGAGELMRG